MKIRTALQYKVPVISKDYISATAENPDAPVQPYILLSPPETPQAVPITVCPPSYTNYNL